VTSYYWVGQTTEIWGGACGNDGNEGVENYVGNVGLVPNDGNPGLGVEFVMTIRRRHRMNSRRHFYRLRALVNVRPVPSEW